MIIRLIRVIIEINRRLAEWRTARVVFTRDIPVQVTVSSRDVPGDAVKHQLSLNTDADRSRPADRLGLAKDLLENNYVTN